MSQLVICAGPVVGGVIDVQSQRVARILEGFGRTRLTRAVIVPFSEADIADAVRGLVARCDVVLLTDSSGLAFSAVAAAFGLQLVACEVLGGASIPECAEVQPGTAAAVTLRVRSCIIVFDTVS